MTAIDTAETRAMADLADRVAPEGLSVGFVSVPTPTVRALCDGYDEAQRLRQNHNETVAVVTADEAQRLRDRLRLSDIDGINLLTERLRAEADADAARQAFADFAADLRELCDGWDRDGAYHAAVTARVRAVIDRHAPEGGR